MRATVRGSIAGRTYPPNSDLGPQLVGPDFFSKLLGVALFDQRRTSSPGMKVAAQLGPDFSPHWG